MLHTLLKALTTDRLALVHSMFTLLGYADNYFAGFGVSKDLVTGILQFKFALPISLGATKWHQGLGPMVFAVHTSQDMELQRKILDLSLVYGTSLQILHSEARKLELPPPHLYQPALRPS